jgi:hypothetical protein
MRSQTPAPPGRSAPLPAMAPVMALLLAAGVAVTLPPRTASAQPPPVTDVAPAPAPTPTSGTRPLNESLSGMAKAEYEGGRVLYADRDYPNAIIKFEKAHELSGDPRLLWNVAVCEKNMRRYARMLRTIRRYQSEAAKVLTPEERQQAAEIIKTVESFVSALTLTTNEAGADVYVDDDKLGQTPLAEPLMVDVGKRRIRLIKPGFKDAVVTPEIVGGGTLVLDMPLEKDVHRGRLQVIAGPEDIITLDGKPVGRATWDGSLSSGGHTLRVTAPTMAPYQSEVVIQDDNVRRVDVTLNPQVRTDTTRTVLWIVGGVVLAAGAAVGGYFLFKPTPVNPTVGSLAPGSVQLSVGGRASPFAFSFGGHR